LLQQEPQESPDQEGQQGENSEEDSSDNGQDQSQGDSQEPQEGASPQNGEESEPQDAENPEQVAESDQEDSIEGTPLPTPEELEEWASEQAADQWLRRIPQNPGGLLRRKFLYQYQRLGIDQDGNYVWPGDEEQPW
jgi:Ca-activated chloride channel family protein